jgi:hypothetical protein
VGDSGTGTSHKYRGTVQYIRRTVGFGKEFSRREGTRYEADESQMSKKSRFQSLVLGCGTKTQRDKVQEPLLKSEFGTQRDDGGIPLGRPPFEWPPPEFQKRVMQLEFYPSVVTFVRL